MFLTLLRPKYWAGHLAMVVCVAVAVGLGVWQLDAWQTRRADAAKDISNEAPVALSTLIGPDSSFPGRSLGRPVTFEGTWGARTAYVADRYLNGQRGYWVVTPLEVAGTGSAIPVVRGWSPRPTSVTPTGTATINGWLQATEGDGPIDEDLHDDVFTNMRLASMVQYLAEPDLYSAYVVAREGGGTDVEQVTAASIPSVSGFTALRNFLYAIEWWVFGGFALFVWIRWCRDSYETVLHPPEPDEDGDA